MGHRKGSLDINPDRDIPLLRQVMHSGVISRSQLYQFMCLARVESSREVPNWRVRRLLAHGALLIHTTPLGDQDDLLRITRAGLLGLEWHGEIVSPASDESGNENRDENLLHNLELNNIHLALLRSGALVGWTSESELRSVAVAGNLTKTKIHDAVANVLVNDRLISFALEYERTQKSARHYEETVALLDRKSAPPVVLYLFPHYRLLSHAAVLLSLSKRHLLLGLLRDFKIDLFEMKVTGLKRGAMVTLGEALLESKGELE
jgi:hypothetical protein